MIDNYKQDLAKKFKLILSEIGENPEIEGLIQ